MGVRTQGRGGGWTPAGTQARCTGNSDLCYLQDLSQITLKTTLGQVPLCSRAPDHMTCVTPDPSVLIIRPALTPRLAQGPGTNVQGVGGTLANRAHQC